VADLGLDGDKAAVFLDDVADGGEAEAGAVALGGEEGVPDFFEDVRGDAVGVVADVELDVGAAGQVGGCAVGEGDGLHAQLDLGTVRRRGHGLDRVDDEVLENLEDLGAIDSDGRDFFGELAVEDGGRAGGGDADGVVEDFGGGEGLSVAGAALGERE